MVDRLAANFHLRLLEEKSIQVLANSLLDLLSLDLHLLFPLDHRNDFVLDLGSLQGHLVKDIKSRLLGSVDDSIINVA